MCADKTNTASKTAGRTAAPTDNTAPLTQDTRTHRRPDIQTVPAEGLPANPPLCLSSRQLSFPNSRVMTADLLGFVWCVSTCWGPRSCPQARFLAVPPLGLYALLAACLPGGIRVRTAGLSRQPPTSRLMVADRPDSCSGNFRSRSVCKLFTLQVLLSMNILFMNCGVS